MFVYKTVHIAAESVQSAAGPAQHGFRAFKQLTVLQRMRKMIR